MTFWVVNDQLTCIPDTKTFWHLLTSIDGARDKTGHPFSVLADRIEQDTKKCNLIIRNGTFFRWINRNCKTISLIQDCYENDDVQRTCIEKSDHVVFNSEFTKDKYLAAGMSPRAFSVIEIGVNQDLFKPYDSHIFKDKRPTGILVGDYNSTKNTRMFEAICLRRTSLDFIYVYKLGAQIK